MPRSRFGLPFQPDPSPKSLVPSPDRSPIGKFLSRRKTPVRSWLRRRDVPVPLSTRRTSTTRRQVKAAGPPARSAACGGDSAWPHSIPAAARPQYHQRRPAKGVRIGQGWISKPRLGIPSLRPIQDDDRIDSTPPGRPLDSGLQVQSSTRTCRTDCSAGRSSAASAL